jgi:hypothetical protein
MVRSEENMSLKNPVTPLGIDPGTVRLVARLPQVPLLIIRDPIFIKLKTGAFIWQERDFRGQKFLKRERSEIAEQFINMAAARP